MADLTRNGPAEAAANPLAAITGGKVLAAAREAGLWAAVSAILCVPILTFQTAEDFNKLKILYHWWILYVVPLVAVLTFARSLAGTVLTGSEAGGRIGEGFAYHLGRVFTALASAALIGIVARFALVWLGQPGLAQTVSFATLAIAIAIYVYFVTAEAGEALYRRLRALLPSVYGVALLVLAFVLPFLPFSDRYVLDTSILILTYVMLGWGLNIVVGLAGLLDLGYVAFYGIGAYSYAILSSHFGLSFWICLPLAGILASFWGIILGFPVLRLRGDYLAIVTLAFGEIIRLVLINWGDLTNGPKGIQINPSLRPGFFGLEFKDAPGGFADFFHIEYHSIHRIMWLYYIILFLALLTNFVTMRLRRLPVGRAWEALREDEIACRSLGINTTNTKLTAFAIGAMFGGFAGSFFATKQGFVSPESFNFLESATILAIVVLGGLGSQLGVVLAAICMIGGIEVLRNLDFLKGLANNWFGVADFDPIQYRMLIFGLALVVLMVWRPRGIVSSRTPSISLGAGKSISGDLVK